MQKNSEVWIAVYTAAIRARTTDYALKEADRALREYNKRFPKESSFARKDDFGGEQSQLPVEEEEIKETSTSS